MYILHIYMVYIISTEQDHQESFVDKLHYLSRSEMSVPSGRMAQARKTLEALGMRLPTLGMWPHIEVTSWFDGDFLSVFYLLIICE